MATQIKKYRREVKFRSGCVFAVVLAAHYRGKGYSTHKTEIAAIRASYRNRSRVHEIIDQEGNVYGIYNTTLSKL